MSKKTHFSAFLDRIALRDFSLQALLLGTEEFSFPLELFSFCKTERNEFILSSYLSLYFISCEMGYCCSSLCSCLPLCFVFCLNLCYKNMTDWRIQPFPVFLRKIWPVINIFITYRWRQGRFLYPDLILSSGHTNHVVLMHAEEAKAECFGLPLNI